MKKKFSINIDLEVYEAIKSIAKHPSTWVIDLIHREIGIPKVIKVRHSDPEIDIRHVNVDKLDIKHQLVVKLWLNGFTASEIARKLNRSGVPSFRGSQWNRRLIINSLENLAQKEAKRQCVLSLRLSKPKKKKKKK